MGEASGSGDAAEPAADGDATEAGDCETGAGDCVATRVASSTRRTSSVPCTWRATVVAAARMAEGSEGADAAADGADSGTIDPVTAYETTNTPIPIEKTARARARPGEIISRCHPNDDAPKRWSEPSPRAPSSGGRATLEGSGERPSVGATVDVRSLVDACPAAYVCVEP